MSTTPVKGMSRHLQDTDLVVAISTDNTFLHVDELGGLIGHLHVHAEESATPSAAAHNHDERVVQFFDSTGHRLLPKLNPNLQLVGFTVSAEDPMSAELLLGRIGEALDAAQARLDADPDLGKQQSLPTATEVPRPTGSLADVLGSLASEFDMQAGSGGHRAGWFHNLFHV